MVNHSGQKGRFQKASLWVMFQFLLKKKKKKSKKKIKKKNSPAC